MKSLLLPIYDEWAGCTRCKLAKTREENSESVCVGNGSVNPRIMLVLDQPTVSDTFNGGYMLGGDSSDLLLDLLDAAKIPKEHVFVTSLLGCRAYNVVPATEHERERVVDRLPEKDELEACGERLHRLVYAADPRLIVAMGDITWKTLVPRAQRESKDISTACGDLFQMQIPGRERTLTYPIIAAYSLRQINTNPNSATKGPLNATITALVRAGMYVDWVTKREISL